MSETPAVDKCQPHLIEAGCKYFNTDKIGLEKRIIECTDKMRDKWNRKVSVREFYEDNEEYIPDLIFFNNNKRVQDVIYPIMSNMVLKNADILDFGAGIGEIGMNFAEGNNVYYWDINKKCKDFAKFLSEKTKRPIIQLEKEEDIYVRQYDMIITTDIFEHLTNPIEQLKLLIKCLKPGGFFLTTGIHAKITPDIPYHLLINIENYDEFDNYIDTIGIIRYYHSTCNEAVYVIQKWRNK